MYPLKPSTKTALSTSLSSVYSYFTYMIGLTKRSHVAPNMQHVTFGVARNASTQCAGETHRLSVRGKRIDSVCGGNASTQCAGETHRLSVRGKRIDSVCGVTWIPLCARDGSVIAWGREEGETSLRRIVLDQCAVGLIHSYKIDLFCHKIPLHYYSFNSYNTDIFCYKRFLYIIFHLIHTTPIYFATKDSFTLFFI